MQTGIKCHIGKAPTQTIPHGRSCNFHRTLYVSNKRTPLSGDETILAYVKEIKSMLIEE